MKRFFAVIACVTPLMLAGGCALITVPYHAAKDVVHGGVWVVTKTYAVAKGTTKVIYKIGAFTFEVAKAPLDWALTHKDLQSIDGLPVREAIRLGKVKSSPYVVGGVRYVPMSPQQARHYDQVGLASWYGYESGTMTADGEVFNPNGLTAAHKYLPIPMFVKVTNLQNGRSLIVRVNDRGPFPSRDNPNSGKRIIDLSMGAAKRLGFYRQGLARVRVEAIRLKEK